MGFSDAADPPLTTAPVNVVVPAALAVIILALIVAAAAWIKSRTRRLDAERQAGLPPPFAIPLDPYTAKMPPPPHAAFAIYADPQALPGSYGVPMAVPIYSAVPPPPPPPPVAVYRAPPVSPHDYYAHYYAPPPPQRTTSHLRQPRPATLGRRRERDSPLADSAYASSTSHLLRF